jgi:peroxiredoxin
MLSSLTSRPGLAVGAFIGALAALASLAPQAAKAGIIAANSRKTAPDFALKDAHGATVRLSNYRGKVVLLNFWATWCEPCKTEIPWFIEFENHYKNSGFVVIGISMEEDGWGAVMPYLQDRKIGYRVVVGDRKLGKRYGGIDALPTTLLIDRRGRIAESHEGLETKSTYEDEIRYLLDNENPLGK